MNRHKYALLLLLPSYADVLLVFAVAFGVDNGWCGMWHEDSMKDGWHVKTLLLFLQKVLVLGAVVVVLVCFEIVRGRIRRSMMMWGRKFSSTLTQHPHSTQLLSLQSYYGTLASIPHASWSISSQILCLNIDSPHTPHHADNDTSTLCLCDLC